MNIIFILLLLFYYECSASLISTNDKLVDYEELFKVDDQILSKNNSTKSRIYGNKTLAMRTNKLNDINSISFDSETPKIFFEEVFKVLLVSSFLSSTRYKTMPMFQRRT